MDPFLLKGDMTDVYWNIDDYPIPVGADLGSIRSNIKESLRLMGFHGYGDINVHCKQLKCDVKDELSKARIF